MIRLLGRMQDRLHNGRIMQDKCIVSLFTAEGGIKKRVLAIVLRTV